MSLCEALDRVLNKGAVLFGEVMISVADIDLVYLGLQVILASMETARGLKPRRGRGSGDRIFSTRELNDETAGTGASRVPGPERFCQDHARGRLDGGPLGPAASLPGSIWTRTTSRTAWDNWS